MHRRTFLKYGSAGLFTLGMGGFLRHAYSQTAPQDESLLRDRVDPCFDNSPRVAPFTVPLAFAPVIDAVGAVQLTEARGEHVFVPGFRTPIWGYEGMFPGPTLVARRNVPVAVTFTNALPPGEDPSGIIIPNNSRQDPVDHPFRDSTTVVHLHGINTDGQLGPGGDGSFSSDGYPEGALSLKNPGESRTHQYPNNGTPGQAAPIYQRPATLWYHDHSVHITSVHLYRGLSGFYVLKDVAEEASGLPGSAAADPGRGIEAGPLGFDVPLVVKDVMLAPEEIDGRPPGTLIYNNCSHFGAFGDLMTVNGKQQPFFEVANRKYRFRLLNGSDSRQYLFAFRVAQNLKSGPNEPFRYIGTDQGLLFTGVPEITTFFHANISERHEFVLDFSKYPIGTRIVMVNLLVDQNDERLFPIMEFRVTRVEADHSQADAWPAAAWAHPADVQPAAITRTFRFNRQGGYWSINSMQFDPLRDDAQPLLDTTEDWVLVNESGGWGHPVHLHLGRFKIMKIQGRAPNPGELTGFKDTVWVGPNQTITVRHQFWNFPGRFVFHCHNGSHEDSDMMSQFNVLPNPGTVGTGTLPGGTPS
ncbi:MAG: multicopper oxidase family protein [Myxococcales bacterium]